VSVHKGGTARLALRCFYTVGELARAARVDRRTVLRMLHVRGVEVLALGNRTYVPLSEIVEKLKPLWDSVQASQERREGREWRIEHK
jgi:hypothetical protein